MFIEENKQLAPFTTFGIGGPARWFVEAASEEDVASAALWARERGADIFVLGGGSNLLISDDGFDGLVVHVALRGVEPGGSSREPGPVAYRVAAGEDWDRFVGRATEAGSAGVECLAGIPGTVGGTPVQNVGAYGQEVSSVIERVRCFDLQAHEFVEFAGDECGFSYRRSRFNSTDKGRYVVTRVDYRLTRGGAPKLHYAELQREFAGRPAPGLVEVAAAVRRIRQSKGMLLVAGDADCRSAGSFFKNPVVSEELAARVAEASGKEPPRFPAGWGDESQGMVKIPAAWLIEQAGFGKGLIRGGAGISSRHSLALINRGGATAGEVLALAEEIRSAVRLRFGIELEREPVLLGFQG
jgi:UDP-N-acetylmuramate dehydrogenase